MRASIKYRSNYILKQIWLFVKIILVSGTLQAQSIEALQTQLAATPKSTQKVDLYNNLAGLYWDINFEIANAYTDSAFQLASSLNYARGLTEVKANLGLSNFAKDQYRSAIAYFNEAYKEAVEMGNKELANKINLLKINHYVLMGNYRLASEEFKKFEKDFEPGSRAYATYLASYGRLKYLQGYIHEAELPLLNSLKIRIDSNYRGNLSSVNMMLAKVKISQSDYLLARKYLLEAEKYALEDQQIYWLANVYVETADYYLNLGKFDSASLNLEKALSIYQDAEFNHGIMMVNQKYTDLYISKINYIEALSYALDALKIAEHLEVKKTRAELYNSLAWIHKDERNFQTGIEYIEKALTLHREMGDKKGEAATLNTLGNIYNLRGEYDQALENLSLSLQLRREIGYSRGESSSLFNIGLIKQKLGNYAAAKDYYQQSLDINLGLGLISELAYEYNALASIAIIEGDIKTATKYLESASETIQQYPNDYSLSRTYELYAQVYEAQGRYADAFQSLKHHKALADSLFNVEKSKLILSMQSSSELEAKENEIALLNANYLAQDAKIRQQSILIYSISAGLLLLSIIAYVILLYSRSKTKANRMLIKFNEEISEQKENLKEANDKIYRINQKLEALVRERTAKLRTAYHELDTFFYKSSHDFRRPLTTFMGLAEVAKVTVKDEQALILFEKVNETAKSLDKMLAKLQSISYVGSQELVFKEVFFRGIVESIISAMEDEIRSKNLNITYEFNTSGPFKSYPLYISLILENLIENAIYFQAADKPHIHISTRNLGDNYIEIKVHDNGSGIPLEFQPKIFDMYFRASERSKGNGLGLYIVKKAVDRLKGSITVESAYGQGTTFTVKLPYNQVEVSIV